MFLNEAAIGIAIESVVWKAVAEHARKHGKWIAYGVAMRRYLQAELKQFPSI